MVSDHGLVSMHLGNHRSGGNRDAIAVSFRPCHNGQRMGKVAGHKIVGTIEQQDTVAHCHALAGKRCEPLHDGKRQRFLNTVLVDYLRRRFPKCVLRKCLSQSLRKGASSLFGDGFRVIEALGPTVLPGAPHDQPRYHGPSQRTTPHLIAPDNAAEASGHEVVFDIEGGIYSGNGRASRTVTPTNVSG